MPRTPETDQICTDCRNRALFAYGTGQLFVRRARRYRWGIRWLAFIGIAGPLLIGGVVVGFGTNPAHLKLLLGAVAIVSIVTLIMSAWSLATSWPENLEYAITSSVDNLELSPRFRELAETAVAPPADLEIRYAALRARDDSRRGADYAKGVSEKERRYGHRAGLVQFQRECAGCKQTPVSMTPSKCEICGRF
jgi:mobilome CxxCx(11)CxxC protein